MPVPSRSAPPASSPAGAMSSGSAHRDPFADYPCCKQVRRSGSASTPGAGGSAGTPNARQRRATPRGGIASTSGPAGAGANLVLATTTRAADGGRNDWAAQEPAPIASGWRRQNPRQGGLKGAGPRVDAGCPCRPLLPPPPARPPGGAGSSGEQTAGPRAGHPSCARRVPRRPGISLKCNPFCSQSLEAKLIAKIFAKLIARTMSIWRRSVYKLFQGSRRNSPCKGALWLQAWLARGPGKTRAPK